MTDLPVFSPKGWDSQAQGRASAASAALGSRADKRFQPEGPRQARPSLSGWKARNRSISQGFALGCAVSCLRPERRGLGFVCRNGAGIAPAPPRRAGYAGTESGRIGQNRAATGSHGQYWAATGRPRNVRSCTTQYLEMSCVMALPWRNRKTTQAPPPPDCEGGTAVIARTREGTAVVASLRFATHGTRRGLFSSPRADGESSIAPRGSVGSSDGQLTPAFRRGLFPWGTNGRPAK